MNRIDEVLDVRDFSSKENPQEDAAAWLEDLFWEPLSPSDFPLARFALAKATSNKYLWLQKYHHLIIDATGRRLVAARTADIYNARALGTTPTMQQSPSYRLAKTDEETYLSSEQYAADGHYWKARFGRLPEPIVTSDSRLTEKARSGRRARLDCNLSIDQSNALRTFAHHRSTTVFKVVLALTWSCFNRLCSKSDFVFGVPVAGQQ